MQIPRVETQPARCAACGGAVPQPLYVVFDLVMDGEGDWPFVCCADCGHGYLDPQPTPQALGQFYKALYTPENTDLMHKVAASGFERRLQKRRVAAIERTGLQAGGAVLDVGAGLGFYLERLVGAFAPERAVGVETSAQAAAEAAKRAGVEIVAQPFEEAQLAAGTFDLVCMNHILEHLVEPGEFVEKAAGLLRPGGLLQVEVPRMDGWARRLFGRWYWPHLPPQHLQLFTRKGLEGLLESRGFEVHSVHTSGYPATASASLVLAAQHVFGSKSGYAHNWLVRGPAALLGICCLPFTLAFDLLMAPLLDRCGAGDILTLVGRLK